MINLTMDNFEAEVTNSDIPVFVDFYADWCGPCKMMAPIVDELEAEYGSKVKFAKCNIDENMFIAQKYRVMSIPTFMVFKNGEKADMFIGGTKKAELAAIIEGQL